MDPTRRPPAPPGTKAAGRRLWRGVVERYELEPHETQLLVEAVRTADVLAELDDAVAEHGVMVETPNGPRPNPAAVEARGQRLVLARLLASLRLPDAPDSVAGRGPRRGMARGVYAVGQPAQQRRGSGA